jgi:hypothetical protein
VNPSFFRLTAGATAAAVIGISSAPSLAAVYQALCTGASECTVTLANGQIGTPGLVIQREQVLSWSQGGSGTKTDVGMGVAATVLFGLPGLIGFAAKNTTTPSRSTTSMRPVMSRHQQLALRTTFQPISS